MAVPTVGTQPLKEDAMRSLKFEPLSSSAKAACAAFALVSAMASLSFVVVSFASASAGSDAPAARLKREAATLADRQSRLEGCVRGANPT